VNRRTFVTCLGAVVAAACAAEAQQQRAAAPRPGGRLPRIGYLGSGHPSDRFSPLFSHLFDSFAEGLRELGYVDGQTVTIEWRFAERRYERLPDLAADLVRVGVDVIFATADHTTAAAKQATSTIPIVFNAASDPVVSQFAVSYSRPSGNMTGLTQAGPQLTEKRLSLLKEAVPTVSRVAVLRNPTGISDAYHLPAAEKAAAALGLQTQVHEASGPQSFDGVFRAIVHHRAQAVLLLPDSSFYIGRGQLAEFALRYRLPMIGSRAEYVRAGALLGYGSVLSAEWRRAGELVGRILNGAKPADIPIEEPSKFELVINLKTAKALGVTIPRSLLLRADQVIE
jgi:putative ABC transport system substrate-binding protein